MDLIDKYRASLKKLLPLGMAWPRGAGANIHKLLDGLAAEPARIHDRADDLMGEMHPATVTELLEEWEAVWGLPDYCVSDLDTLGERRSALMSRIRLVGGQTPGFFIRLAAEVGYTVTVTENVGGNPTVWRINAPPVTVRWARAGQSRAGNSIRTWGNEILECTIQRVAPAHLQLLFAYS